MKAEAKKVDFLKWSTAQRDLPFLLLLSAILKTTMALLIPAINHDGPLYIAAAQKIAFYAGRQDYYDYHGGYDNLTMEKFAVANGADLLIIKRSKRKRDKRVQLKRFREVKGFAGVKDIIYIYCSPKLYEMLNRSNGY